MTSINYSKSYYAYQYINEFLVVGALFPIVWKNNIKVANYVTTCLYFIYVFQYGYWKQWDLEGGGKITGRFLIAGKILVWGYNR